MLDSQTPNVQIIAYSHNDVHDKAPVDSNTQAKTREHERDLVDILSQRAWPTESKGLLQTRAKCIDNPKGQREGDDILVRKVHHDKVGSDDLAHAVGVDQADVEDEWDQVVIQDVWLKHQVCGDDGPR